MIERTLICTERRRCGRRRPRAVLALASLGLGLIGLATLARPAPWLVWNASASAPIGFYRVLPGHAVRGDLVLVHTPASIRKLAAERRYLPSNVPLVKRIVAAGGDVVCAAGDAISINGRVVAERLARDRLGRPLPTWTGCQTLEPDDVFLLMEDVTGSFDSRYFGPVPTAAIIGRLAPLWVE
ncbi:S26 family signal peptidase [Tistrella bauzanensis]|uniref:S26 family signal peptidase n=1 Tax=Tistrella TaxID=171436 RepID=UPI0031F625B2